MYEQEQLKKFQKVQVAKDRITLIMQENEETKAMIQGARALERLHDFKTS